MKKLFAVGVSFIFLFSLVGCAENAVNVSQEGISTATQNFSVTEIEKYNFEERPEQFTLINLNPCVLVDGVAYLYADGTWNEIQSDKKVSQIYSGDIFCGLTEDGEIIVGFEDWNAYESYPLGSSGLYYNAEEMLKSTEGEKIISLSAGIFNEYIIAAFEDGKTECYVNGTGLTVTDSLHIKELSGK